MPRRRRSGTRRSGSPSCTWITAGTLRHRQIGRRPFSTLAWSCSTGDAGSEGPATSRRPAESRDLSGWGRPRLRPRGPCIESGAVLVHRQPVHEGASSKGGCHVRFAVPRPGSGGATRRSIGRRGRHPHRRLSRPGRRPGSRRCGRLWRGARGAPTPGCPGQHCLRRPDPADRPRRGVQRDHHRHRHHRYGRGDPAGQRRRQRSAYRGHRELPAWRARARHPLGVVAALRRSCVIAVRLRRIEPDGRRHVGADLPGVALQQLREREQLDAPGADRPRPQSGDLRRHGERRRQPGLLAAPAGWWHQPLRHSDQSRHGLHERLGGRGGQRGRRRLLGGHRRRRRVCLRCTLLRLHGRHPVERAHRRHRQPRPTTAATGWQPPTVASTPSAMRRSTARSPGSCRRGRR